MGSLCIPTLDTLHLSAIGYAESDTGNQYKNSQPAKYGIDEYRKKCHQTNLHNILAARGKSTPSILPAKDLELRA
jgi:hypothetical protein